MPEPRGSARDSSLQDRKAPENCLLRTGQPRLGNVVPMTGVRHHPIATPPLLLLTVWLSFLVMLSTRSAAAPSAAAMEACAALV